MTADTLTTDTTTPAAPSFTDGAAPGTMAGGELLQAGGRIEVWNQFLGSWTGEFEIAAIGDEGYRIRRSTDNTVLPRAFPAHDVRPAP